MDKLHSNNHVYVTGFWKIIHMGTIYV